MLSVPCPLRRLAPLVLAVLILGAEATVRAQTPALSRRVLTAKRAAAAPVAIDGDLSDPIWKTAARVEGFTDRQTGNPAADPTVAWIAYDDTAVYIAFECRDSVPSGIVGRETLRDSRYQQGNNGGGTEDAVEVSLDPFLSFKRNDFARFSVNPLGTRSARIGGGRAGKAEWNGEWDAAARTGPDGWSAEMRIPWVTLNYPSGGKDITVGLNFTRFQYRTRIESQWSYTGIQGFDDLEGRWQGVTPPRSAFKPKLSLLPYVLPKIDEKGGHERTGIDARYTITPDLTLVASANPDFATVEGAVQNIAFSRAEQFVPERRPFFLEGGDYFEAGSFFSLGPLFYSNRIGAFDFGAKAFGKLSPRDTVGVLATADFGNRADVVLRYRRDLSPTDQIGFFATRTENALTNQHAGVAAFLGQLRRDKVGLGWQAVASDGTGAGGFGGQLNLQYSDGPHFTSLQYLDAARNFANPNGLIFFNDFKGFRLFHYTGREWRKGAWRSWSVNTGPRYTWRQDGRPFQRGVDVGIQFETRSDWRFGINADDSRFDSQADRTIGGQITMGATNRFRQLGLNFGVGTRGGASYRLFSPSASVRVGDRLDLIFASALQRYAGWTRQQVLTANYLLSRTRTVGGRLVVQNLPGEKSAVNGYLSFRNAGEAGTEIYLLVGDPNATRFRNLTMLKFIFAV